MMFIDDRKSLLKELFAKYWDLEFSIAGDSLTEDCIDVFLDKEKRFESFDGGAKFDFSQLIEQLTIIIAFIDAVLGIYDRFRTGSKPKSRAEEIDKEILEHLPEAKKIPKEERINMINEEVVKKIEVNTKRQDN